MHGIAWFLGLTNASGGWYLWWSGIVGDIALVGGATAIYHKHNCHEPRCYRIGKHTVDGSPWCNHHHEQARERA